MKYWYEERPNVMAMCLQQSKAGDGQHAITLTHKQQQNHLTACTVTISPTSISFIIKQSVTEQLAQCSLCSTHYLPGLDLAGGRPGIQLIWRSLGERL